MRPLKFILLASILSFLSSCTPIHKQSVEDERWVKIIEDYKSDEINKFFNDYPDSKHYTSLIEFMRHIEFDEDLFPHSCNKNFSHIQMANNDSVWIDYKIFGINQVEKEIYDILQWNYSKTDFVDHLGIERHFSNSVFAISLRDSIPMNQEVLVKVKTATNQYRDSLIQIWYPSGYPIELVNSKFEKKMDFNLFLSWRKPPPIPPKPFY